MQNVSNNNYIIIFKLVYVLKFVFFTFTLKNDLNSTFLNFFGPRPRPSSQKHFIHRTLSNDTLVEYGYCTICHFGTSNGAKLMI